MNSSMKPSKSFSNEEYFSNNEENHANMVLLSTVEHSNHGQI